MTRLADNVKIAAWEGWSWVAILGWMELHDVSEFDPAQFKREYRGAFLTVEDYFNDFPNDINYLYVSEGNKHHYFEFEEEA